jgi:hypothetical protein
MTSPSFNPSKEFILSTIQSLGCQPDMAASRVRPGSFEANSQEYGPVVATVMGAGDALGGVASATYDFSKSALQELARDGEQAWSGLQNEAASVASDAMSAWDQVATWAHEGVNELEEDAVALKDDVVDAASTAGHALYSGASEVADTLGTAVSGTASVLGQVASYAANGASAAYQALSELA